MRRHGFGPQALLAYNTSTAESPETFQFVPVIDGPGGIIPDLPSTLVASGKFSKIPTMTGTNLDDGTSSVLLLSSSSHDQKII